MKVLLVGINSKFIHSNLAIRYLKAFTSDLNYECKLKEFSINDRTEKILENIIKEKPNLVAFSCYIWNMEYVQEIAKLVKLVSPSIELLYGGPEVSYESSGFLQENAGEYLIEGEGEITYREFISRKISGEPLNCVRGLYCKTSEGIVCGGIRDAMDMQEIKFPYGDEDDLCNKIVYYEASRGCPFRCKYCLSSTAKGVRFLSIERVKKDLEFLIAKGVKLVKFVDRTFNCNSKFAMAIWEFLIEKDTETTFHFEISADILTDEEILLLQRAKKGRFQFEIGVQSTNNETLRDIERHVKFEELKNRINELKRLNNISLHLDLIAGLPNENFSSFKKSFNDVYNTSPNKLQLGFLKLLKGSLMRAEVNKWNMIYSPLPPYEILRTKDISYEELVSLKKLEEMVDKYYNSEKFNTILSYMLRGYDNAFDFYLDLSIFFEEKGYFSRNISGIEYYKVFLEFNEEKLKKNNRVLKEFIRFDFLKYNRKNWLPDFLERQTDKAKLKEIKKLIKNDECYRKYEKCHLESFNVDIIKFIQSGLVIEEKRYLIFGEEENNIIDVTYFLNTMNI